MISIDIVDRKAFPRMADLKVHHSYRNRIIHVFPKVLTRTQLHGCNTRDESTMGDQFLREGLRSVGPHPLSISRALLPLPSSPRLRPWTGRRQGSRIEHWPYCMRAEKLVPTSSQQDSVPSSVGPEQGADPQGEATVSRQGPASSAGRECFEN